MKRIEYPLFIDLNPSYVETGERNRMIEHFKSLPYWRGIDPYGRVWLGFQGPEERNLTRDALNMVLMGKMGYRCEQIYETIQGFRKMQNQ